MMMTGVINWYLNNSIPDTNLLLWFNTDPIITVILYATVLINGMGHSFNISVEKLS